MERRHSEPIARDNESQTSNSSQASQLTLIVNYMISFVYKADSTEESTLPQHSNISEITQATNHVPRRDTFNNHLILVLPHMKRAACVQQPVADWILSDQGFFSALGAQYRAARGAFRSAISWKSLADMRFVKFDMLRSGLAQVQKLDDIPPPHTQEYEYEPVSWSPPIGPQLLLHLMEHPQEAEADQVLFKWVPKKLREKLEPCAVKGHCHGWGIQFIEDVDRERVSAIVFVCAVASVVVALAWAICRHDVQGGFTIAGTMFVILTTGVASLETFART